MTTAKEMRAWMVAQKWPFSVSKMCEALGIPPGKDRECAYWALKDFLRRGEAMVHGRTRSGRAATYRYNHGWRPARKGTLRGKILKAMHVYAGEAFSSSDIQRFSGARDRNFVNKIIRKLVSENYLNRAGKRRCAHGYGREYLYMVADRKRFRVEVMR
jgi:hypothetical protein